MAATAGAWAQVWGMRPLPATSEPGSGKRDTHPLYFVFGQTIAAHRQGHNTPVFPYPDRALRHRDRVGRFWNTERPHPRYAGLEFA